MITDNKNVFSAVKWVFFVSSRFSKVDRKGKSAITSVLASLGICFGVMTLITVISVMNGFQMSFIDSIMEVSSYDVRVKNVGEENLFDFNEYCTDNKLIKSFTPFYEAQSLVVGNNGLQTASLIRAVPFDIRLDDEGFRKEVKMWSGKFDLTEPNSIVLGTELSRRLGVHTGSVINLFALSGGSDVDLLSEDRIFTVTGIFRTGYADINASYAFINIDDGVRYFGKDSDLIFGLKLKDQKNDTAIISDVQSKFVEADCQSWRSYNRSFFGALRVEKNMLLLLVLIIFIVVAINIYNGMRRMVYEKREEIAVLSSFGAKDSDIQFIFILQGFMTGFAGAVPGLILGLLLSVNMSSIFSFMSKSVFYIQYFFLMLFASESAEYIRENPMYRLYANIPPRIVISEVILITIFGIFSALFASWMASKGILKLTVAEVMRDE